MILNRFIPPVLALVLMFCFGMVSAQMSGSSNAITAGGPVGGGGSSSTSNYAVAGAVPLMGTGVSAGSSYIVSGGGAAMYSGVAAFTATYAGNAVDTVTVADRTLQVAFSGGEGAATGTIYYRQGGATIYQSAAMTVGTGDTLEYDLSSGLLTVRGLEFYFAITRGTSSTNEGSASAPYIFVTSLTNAQGQRPSAMPDARYRIVGLPVSPSSGSVTAVFPDDLGSPDPVQWRLGSYSPSLDSVIEYPNAASVTPGRGYWLIARGGKTYGSAGTSIRPNRSYGGNDYYEVALDSGWNQLANPLPFDVSWSDILFDDDGSVLTDHPVLVLDDSAYYYNGSAYQTVQTINAWEGVFVLIKKQNVKALVPYHEGSKGTAKRLKQLAESSSFDNWSVHLRLEANGLTDDGNLIGVREDALSGADRYDFAEPPPAPGAPRLAFRLPGEATYPCRTDYRPPYWDGVTWDLEFSKVPGRSLTAVGLDQVPEGMETWLFLDDGAAIRLTEGNQVRLPDNVTTARLIISNKEYLADEADLTLPLEYALNQNYPNPFNAGTSIRFAVREPGFVSLEVYNVIGQRIRLLVGGEMGAGEYAVTWDGSDDDGSEVASGIYFYRISAGDFVQCRKMILLK
jgi:ribosomal protein L27